MKNLKTAVEDLRFRVEREYQLFYRLSRLPSHELVNDMKDSDFDAFTDGSASREECISRYREKCAGRLITAGNISSELRALLNVFGKESQ